MNKMKERQSEAKKKRKTGMMGMNRKKDKVRWLT